MATLTLHPRARYMAWLVVVLSVLLMASPLGAQTPPAPPVAPAAGAAPARGGARTPEQLLADAITGSAGRTVTYVLTTSITLTKELPAVPPNANLKIEGNCGAQECVIDGAGRFKIIFGYGSQCTITLKKLKLQNALGGAINTKCNVVIHKCTLSRNKGGGLFIGLGSATWTIEDSLFEHNEAGAGVPTDGAAIFTSSNGRGRVVRTVFTKNRAPNGKGGAVYLATGGDGITHGFHTCRFDSNEAKLGGGAFYVETRGMGTATPMRVYFVESTFEKNVATAGNGGAVAMTSPVGVSFCGGVMANKQNRAVKGNDLALIQNTGHPPISATFCSETGRPAGLSVDIAPSADLTCVLTNCLYCNPPE